MPVALLLACWLVACPTAGGGRADSGSAAPLPVTCADEAGVEHAAGDTWDAGDGCNTCTCESDGTTSCTDLGCPIPLDECGWIARQPSDEARLVADVEWLDSWDFENEGLTVMTTAEGLATWWAHTGWTGSADVDFASEIAVGFIGDWSPGCGEGERLVGLAAGDAEGSWYAGIASTPACDDVCDDHLPRATLYAIPAGDVEACRFGWTCGG